LISCSNDNGSAFVVTGKRRVGVVQSQPAYALDVTGEIRATGDIIAYSDARIKTNVKTIESALEKTMSLRGVTYTRTDIDDKRTKLGVIAQEVLEILPEVVDQDERGKYSVSYGNMTALLIEAVKELSHQNRTQQAEIDTLKGQLASVLQRSINGRI
jgi:hypothetical protein